MKVLISLLLPLFLAAHAQAGVQFPDSWPKYTVNMATINDTYVVFTTEYAVARVPIVALKNRNIDPLNFVEVIAKENNIDLVLSSCADRANGNRILYTCDQFEIVFVR